MANIGSGASRDGILAKHLRGYGPTLSQFRADRIFKTAEVDDFTGVFMELANAFGTATNDLDFFRSQLGSYPGLDFTVSSQTGWSLDDMGVSYAVDEKAARRLAGPATMVDAVKYYGRQSLKVLLLRRELLAAGKAMDTSAASTASRSVTLTAPDQVQNTSSPLIANIDTWHLAFADAQGIMPNAVDMDDRTALAVNRHPGVVEYLSRTFPSMGRITDSPDMTQLEQAMARVFKVKTANVCAAKYNNAQADQTPTLTRVWGRHILLRYETPAIVEGEPNGACIRYQLRGGDNQTVRRWQTMGGLVEHRSISYDEQFVNEASWDEAYLIVDAHSA